MFATPLLAMSSASAMPHSSSSSSSASSSSSTSEHHAVASQPQQVAIVHLAPIIKTSQREAMALDINMIRALNPTEEYQGNGNDNVAVAPINKAYSHAHAPLAASSATSPISVSPGLSVRPLPVAKPLIVSSSSAHSTSYTLSSAMASPTNLATHPDPNNNAQPPLNRASSDLMKNKRHNGSPLLSFALPAATASSSSASTSSSVSPFPPASSKQTLSSSATDSAHSVGSPQTAATLPSSMPLPPASAVNASSAAVNASSSDAASSAEAPVLPNVVQSHSMNNVSQLNSAYDQQLLIPEAPSSLAYRQSATSTDSSMSSFAGSSPRSDHYLLDSPQRLQPSSSVSSSVPFGHASGLQVGSRMQPGTELSRLASTSPLISNSPTSANVDAASGARLPFVSPQSSTSSLSSASNKRHKHAHAHTQAHERILPAVDAAASSSDLTQQHESAAPKNVSMIHRRNVAPVSAAALSNSSSAALVPRQSNPPSSSSSSPSAFKSNNQFSSCLPWQRQTDDGSRSPREHKAHRARKSRIDKRSSLQSESSGCCGDLMSCSPFRLSFKLTLVMLCMLQIIISVGIVWWLGFMSSELLINNLSSQLRQTALAEITSSIHDQMSLPMSAVNQLTFSYSRYRPTLDTLTTLSNTTGIYGDLSIAAMTYPSVSAFGCITATNLLFSAINISAYLSAGVSPDTTQGVTSGYAYVILNSDQPSNARYYLPPNNTNNPSQQDPNQPLPDFNASSTIAELDSLTLWYSVSPYTAINRPQYLAGADAGGDFAWTSIYQLARSANASALVPNQSLIAASKAQMVNGDVGFVCFASVFLHRLGDVLRSLAVAYGPNGIAVVLDQFGMLIACSDLNLASIGENTFIYNSDNPTLASISAALQRHNLFSSTPQVAAPTGQFVFGGTIYQSDPAFDAESISIDGSPFHIQATVLNSTGLLWTIVVVTKDSDFDSNLSYHQLVVGMLSLTVLVVSLLIMIIVTHCLNRPLSLVVHYMSAVANMSRDQRAKAASAVDRNGKPPTDVPRSAEQVKALKEIYRQWQAAVTLDLDENDQEVSRVGRSSVSDKGPVFFPQGGVSDTNERALNNTNSSSASNVSFWRWVGKFFDRGAVCLMREVETLQLTFHAMIHQLTKSTQELERANEAKRGFLRYIWHEIRVPLNAVMLGIVDLRSGCGPRDHGAVPEPTDGTLWNNEQRDVLDIVHEQLQVVGRILSDVLSLHKIEDGALSLQFAPFSLESMILSTMQSFQPGIVEKNIMYTAQLQTVQSFVFPSATLDELAQLPQISVVGDKYRLRQVLSNFLSNCLKFTPANGRVHVSLQILPMSTQETRITYGDRFAPSSSASSASTASDDAPGFPTSGSFEAASHSLSARRPVMEWPLHAPTEAMFRIAVRDSGVGVSTANQSKLFSPYMQILPGEQQAGGGSGLGLSISRSLIHLHKGEIGYVTPPSEWQLLPHYPGSEFFFEVPMKLVYRSSNSLGTGTPQTSRRQMDHAGDERGSEDSLADGTNSLLNTAGSSREQEIDANALLGGDERQAEEHFIKELASLQRDSFMQQEQQQHQQQAEGVSPSSSTSVGADDAGAAAFSSAFRLARIHTPDSLSRLQPQRMHALSLPPSSSFSSQPEGDLSMPISFPSPLSSASSSSASGAASPLTSPQVQQTSRRLINLARVPSSRAVEDLASSAAGTPPAKIDSPSASSSYPLASSPFVASPSAPSTPQTGTTPNIFSLHTPGTKSVSLVMSGAGALLNGTHSQGPISAASSASSSASSPKNASVRRSPGASSRSLVMSARALAPHNSDSLNLASISRDDERHSSTSGMSSSSSSGTASPADEEASGKPRSRQFTYSNASLSNHSSESGESDSSVAAAARDPSKQPRSSLSLGPRSDFFITLSGTQSPSASHAAQHVTSPFSAESSSSSSVLSPSDVSSSPSSVSSAPSSSPLSVHTPSSAASPAASSSLETGAAVAASSVPKALPRTFLALDNNTAASSDALTITLPHEHSLPALNLPISPTPNSPIETQPVAPSTRLFLQRPPVTSDAVQAQSRSLAPMPSPLVITSPTSSTPSPPASLFSPASSATVAVLPPAPTVSTAHTLRILVAEDSLPNLKLLLMLLRKQKCLAEGVENGQLCVEKFTAWHHATLEWEASAAASTSPPPQPPFDMLILDGNMPVLSGLDAARTLRSMGLKLPIYAITGNSLSEDVDAFIAAGADAVLSKPVQHQELLRILHKEQRKKLNNPTVAPTY